MPAQKKVDAEMVVKLAAIGCTNKEIASVLNCNDDHLARAYKDELSRGREQGKTRLRQKQMEVALSGNTTMLIWLGKQILGQTDKQEINNTNPVQVRLNWGSTENKLTIQDAQPGVNSANT